MIENDRSTIRGALIWKGGNGLTFNACHKWAFRHLRQVFRHISINHIKSYTLPIKYSEYSIILRLSLNSARMS